MTDDLLTTLLPALDVAAFKRDAGGSFTPIAPPPPWFTRLADVTFPFLGHILDDANEFWRSGRPGTCAFGPCAEVDETGREFHYTVKAIMVAPSGNQFLVFELDRGSEQLREVLQKAREQTLALDSNRENQSRSAADIRRTGREILQLLHQLSASSTNTAQAELLTALRAKCSALIKDAEQ
jgi:hypothetical protein